MTTEPDPVAARPNEYAPAVSWEDLEAKFRTDPLLPSWPWSVDYAARMYPERLGELLEAVLAGIEQSPCSAETVLQGLVLDAVGHGRRYGAAWAAVPDAARRLRRLLGTDEFPVSLLAGFGLAAMGRTSAAGGILLPAAARDLALGCIAASEHDDGLLDEGFAILEATPLRSPSDAEEILGRLLDLCGTDLSALDELEEGASLKGQWDDGEASRGAAEAAVRGLAATALDSHVRPGEDRPPFLETRILEAFRDRGALCRSLDLGPESFGRLASFVVCLSLRPMMAQALVGAEPWTAAAAAAQLIRSWWSRDDTSVTMGRLLARWAGRGREAGPVVEALEGLGDDLLRKDCMLTPALMFARRHPTPRFAEILLRAWRPGDGPVAETLCVLLDLFRPDDPDRGAVEADVQAWFGLQDGVGDRTTAAPRLRCLDCGAIHWHRARRVVVTPPDGVAVGDAGPCPTCQAAGPREVAPHSVKAVLNLAGLVGRNYSGPTWLELSGPIAPPRRQPPNVWAAPRSWSMSEIIPTPVARLGVKVGRNDPCPCGSGKKYKKCCQSPAPGSSTESTAPPPSAPPVLCTLRVLLDGGPVTEEFEAANPVVWRSIAMTSDQTLEDLHHAIFDAFERCEEHLYEFILPPRGRRDGRSVWYRGPADLLDGGPDPRIATIASLGLRTGTVFWYRFDPGDGWKHSVTVTSVSPDVPPGRYPTVVDWRGASPPQYPDRGEP